MSIGIGANLTGSFGYAKDKLVGNIVNWILLIILSIIPIVNFIAMGTYLKVYRGEDPKVANIGKSFVDGLLAAIIAFIYMLIPMIIFAIVLGASIPAMMMGDLAAIGAAGIGIIICMIVFMLFSLLMLPAMVNFARKGFGAAFAFNTIFGMIGKAGWLNYILSIIVLAVIFGLIGFICGIIPILGMIILLIIFPLLTVWAAKFWATLFA
ncbi:MAG TPA: DUF4013 domain-containing protein [Methanocorpusculum sp.]|nr:DUF4013 domain-containing protein [Methanocorpusculum sp.]HJJ53464.1 DUF4013 domain-containing protein [Methanocorpusculum sp.]